VTQPIFVPITHADQVRPSFAQESTAHRTGRPSEVRTPHENTSPGTGFHGPDQGFALTLAHRLLPTLTLRSDENHHDVEVAGALIASRRAASLGRAPSIYDLQVAFGIFGFFGNAPADLVDYRQQAFQAISHNYVAQRALADQIPASTLALNPGDVREPSEQWRDLLGLSQLA
jgi:hypothetical protein